MITFRKEQAFSYTIDSLEYDSYSDKELNTFSSKDLNRNSGFKAHYQGVKNQMNCSYIYNLNQKYGKNCNRY